MVALGSDSSAGREPSLELDERAANALRTVERLTELSRIDWLFADLPRARRERAVGGVQPRAVPKASAPSASNWPASPPSWSTR